MGTESGQVLKSLVYEIMQETSRSQAFPPPGFWSLADDHKLDSVKAW